MRVRPGRGGPRTRRLAAPVLPEDLADALDALDASQGGQRKGELMRLGVAAVLAVYHGAGVTLLPVGLHGRVWATCPQCRTGCDVEGWVRGCAECGHRDERVSPSPAPATGT